MWKLSFLTLALATVLLGGCNWGNNATDNTPLENAERDVRNGVDNVEDAVTPDNRDNINDNGIKSDGVINESGINNGTNPNSNVDMNGTNGVDGRPNVNDNNVPNTNGANNGVNNEDIIEDEADRRDRDNIDNK